MGNKQTKTKISAQELGPLLNKIATQYIITLNFQDLANLEKQSYCNKLVILTSKIFNKFLDKKEVKYLEQRLQRGVLIDKMDSDTLIYLDKANLGKLDVKNSIRKKRMCIGIARYYIKIGHLFAAILKTLNPEYIYKDKYGQPQRVSLLEKGEIPKQYRNTAANYPLQDAYNAMPQRVQIPLLKNLDNSLCARRIKALTPKKNRQGRYNIRVCKVNRSYPLNTGIPGALNTSKTLAQEVGIPELNSLYLDGYDYGTGKFTKMTKESKAQYLQDVAIFYRTFTGKSKVPSNITSFKQIPLADFHNHPPCQKPAGLLQQSFSYDPKSNVYISYAKHLSKMMNNATNNQNKLIAQLKKVFTKEVNQVTKREEWTLQPSLSYKKLDAIIKETRKLIIELYTQCEKDFRQGIKLFEAVVEKKEQIRNENRREHLEEEFNKLLK